MAQRASGDGGVGHPCAASRGREVMTCLGNAGKGGNCRICNDENRKEENGFRHNAAKINTPGLFSYCLAETRKKIFHKPPPMIYRSRSVFEL
jgi:hypothetical protein